MDFSVFMIGPTLGQGTEREVLGEEVIPAFKTPARQPAESAPRR